MTSSRLTSVGPAAATLVRDLADMAPRGLAAAYLPDSGLFAQTVRALRSSEGVKLRVEGSNVRYAAIAALGLGRLPDDLQQSVLGGRRASDIARLAGECALDGDDPGAVALAAWAGAELDDTFGDKLFGRMCDVLASDTALATVDTAWMLTAAVAAARLGDTDEVLESAAHRLLGHQGARGIFPHVLPPESQTRWRSHVGSFADQVYPVQALARAASQLKRPEWLSAANETAARICELQGPHGQWWWHYDHRDGRVVERFPVYSVHQHAMAPMVLLDLLEAGGTDHRDAVERGIGWLRTHPEVVEELVAERWGLVWRKVGRREPTKAARAINALTTAVRPGLRVPGLDRLMPARVVDHECRPYELGWLLYAWRPMGGDGR